MPAGPGEFEMRVREVILAVPPGDVATYGEVAEEAGFPGAARAVGNVLARGEGLPWWRIVTATRPLGSRARGRACRPVAAGRCGSCERPPPQAVGVRRGRAPASRRTSGTDNRSAQERRSGLCTGVATRAR
ncbi:MAG: MGMT family protein [Actinomycetota bacterium]